MELTKKMVDELNLELKNLKCGFRFRFEEATKYTSPKMEVIIAETKFVSNCILNLNDEFYEFLEKFFKKYNIALSYNNDRSIMWAKAEN